MIQVKVIVPRAFKVEPFRKELTATMEKFLDAVAKDYDKTEETRKEKAQFERKIEQKSDAIVGTYATSDKIVKFLDEGTKVRYATMSQDFEPKTRTRWLGSGPGAGKMLFISKKHPRPGIKARRWTAEIKKVESAKLLWWATIAIGKAAQESGHGVT